MARASIRPGLLPLLVALALLLAAHLAWWLLLRAGHVEACIPYLHGCTSISRAARHSLGNALFRLLVPPCALLLAAHWWLAARWVSAAPERLLVALGALAASALAVYATFLGSDGAAYAFLRRYGITVFFGCGFLAQLRVLQCWRQAGAARRPALWRAMCAVCAGMLLLGVASVAADALLRDRALQDRVGNALEWQLGLLLVAWYLLQARLWRGQRLVLEFPPPAG